jgi:hypothetical protein
MTHSARFSTLLSFAALVVLAWSLAPRAGAEDETKGREEQAVRTQQPADVTEAFWDAYRAEQWEEAIACGLKMEAAHPGGSLIAYNLACVYSRAGDAENALKWLGAAAERGFSSTDLVREDADLATIRPLDEFGEIVQRIDQNEKMEREAVRQLFIEHPPKILLPREYDPKRPMGVLISLHGYGGRATGYPLRWRRTAAEFGLILVAPQAVHRVEGTVGYAWGGMEETEFLMDITLEALREQFTIDEDRIIISGFSQGDSWPRRWRRGIRSGISDRFRWRGRTMRRWSSRRSRRCRTRRGFTSWWASTIV